MNKIKTDRIKKVREARGMTQGEFAEALGVDRSLVSRWENGKKIPQLDTLIRISDVLNCSFLVFVDNQIAIEAMIRYNHSYPFV